MSIKNFSILVLAVIFLTNCANSNAQVENKNSKIENSSSSENKNPKAENADEKAVRLAGEFIKRNGYTAASADKENLSHETVEFHNNIDELLELRHNTLQPKAYGFLREGRSKSKGWTVVFRYNRAMFKDMSDEEYNSSGRAVTMDENFENLLVEHKDIFLKAVKVKFEK